MIVNLVPHYKKINFFDEIRYDNILKSIKRISKVILAKSLLNY